MVILSVISLASGEKKTSNSRLEHHNRDEGYHKHRLGKKAPQILSNRCLLLFSF